MQKLKMLSLLSAALLLTWCSTVKVNQPENLTGDIMTWEIATGIVESGIVNTEIMTGTETTISWDTVTGTNTMVTPVIDDPKTTAEESALKEKIRVLIEKRKIGSKPATELTEDDIQLMTDVLKAIVDETGK